MTKNKQTNSKKKDKKENRIPSLTDEELKKVAMGIYDSTIFCDRQVKEDSMLPTVFMPISLRAFAGFTKEEIADIGLIYEDMDKAMPNTINGYPIFGSLRLLNKADAEKTFVFYDEYKALKSKFLHKGGKKKEI